MRLLGLVKRFVPFLLTFAAGLFIASFFVSIAAPSFQFKNRSWKQRENYQLKQENQWLRQRNEQLEREKNRSISEFEMNLDVPPPPMPPMPPPPPRMRAH